MVFSKAIQGFIFYITAASYSPITIKNYTFTLNQVGSFLEDKDVNKVTTKDLQSYFVHLHDSRKVGNATIQFHWKVIRSFYNWAEQDLNITPRPDKAIPMPEYQSRAIIPFAKEEVDTIIKTTRSKRNKALILTLLDTGVRVSELSRLTLHDVDFETGTVRVNAWQTGRKSRARIVYLGKLSRRVLWQYIASRDDLTGKENAALFATTWGKPLDRFAVKNILYRISSRTGIKGIHPHRFRHTFAIQYLRNGGDVFTLQRLLGHANLDIVRRYLAIADTDIQSAHRLASPADRWGLG